jgi:predicted lipid-binding transport protein (Tim44 family)
MLKKILASVMIFSLFFAPVANVFDHNPTEVSAKSYKSGKKSFNSGTNNSPSLFKKDNDQQVNKQKTTNSSTATKSKSGGLLKGLMIGGMAGLLFGSLLGNLGALGSIIGFMINIVAIIALIMIIRKVFTMIKKKRREANPWEQ